MKPLLPFVFFCFSVVQLSAQEEEQPEIYKPPIEVSFDASLFYTSMIDKDFFGLSMDIKVHPNEKWATGLSLSTTSRRINETYSYIINNPDISYTQIGWINQFDIIKEEKFRFAFQFNSALAVLSLRERDAVEEIWNEEFVAEYPVILKTNYMFVMEPGVEMAVRVMHKENSPDLYITSKARYRHAIGGSMFGNSEDFSNYFFGIGVSVVGLFDRY